MRWLIVRSYKVVFLRPIAHSSFMDKNSELSLYWMLPSRFCLCVCVFFFFFFFFACSIYKVLLLYVMTDRKIFLNESQTCFLQKCSLPVNGMYPIKNATIIKTNWRTACFSFLWSFSSFFVAAFFFDLFFTNPIIKQQMMAMPIVGT